MSNKRLPRRKLLIYPRFQLMLILINVLIFLGAFVFIFAHAYFAYSKLHAMGVQVQLPPTHGYFKFIDMQSSLLYNYLAIAGGVSLVVTSLITLLLTHKLVGPLYRLQTYFNDMGDTGTFAPISFRKGDFLQELPVAINKGLDRIKSN